MRDVLVALDLEATGMEPGRDRIIEIGAVKFQGGRVVDRFESLVRPDREVSFSIESLTGLSNANLKSAPRLSDVGPKLRGFVGDAPIVGQSVEMDLAMLEGAGIGFSNRHFDTFELATILIPELRTYDLGTIAGTLGVTVPDRHRAVTDAETSMVVFNRLVERAAEFDETTLQRLRDLTRQSRSPLSYVFRSLLKERQRERDELGNTSIGAQFLAKLGSDESSGPEAMFLVPRERPARLEDTGNQEPIAPVVLDAAMDPSGPFARAMAGYEPRPQQVEMMQAVATNIAQSGQLLVEAGTGTGKSLGYLLPAALHAVQQGDPVVISTATIALQDQLINKDIPALRRAAEQATGAEQEQPIAGLRDLRATVLKGRGNYLCLRRWFLAQREQPQNETDAELRAKVTAWLHQTETGDRAELRLSPEQLAHWRTLAEEEGACVPSQCVFHRRNQCFLFRARHQAEASHIIIVNHSLLLSDLLRGGSVLPTFRHLIIDEAQHLEGEATVQAGYSVSHAQATYLLRRIFVDQENLGLGGALGLTFRAVSGAGGATSRSVAQDLQSRLTTAMEAVDEAHRRLGTVFRSLGEFIQQYNADSGGYERRVRVTSGVRNEPTWSQIEIEWDQAAEPLGRIIQIIRHFYGRVETISADDLATRQEVLTELELLEDELENLLAKTYAMLCHADTGLVCWLARHQTSGEVSIHAVPLHVADLLNDELYPRVESLTLTSATLMTEGTFSFVRERLGLDDADELQVPSPFDYRSSTLLAVADDIPEPNQPGHQKQIQQALIRICKASRGRAMVLFTSHNALQTSYHAIKRTLEDEGILVLGQRVDGSPRQLLERLNNQPETVLLGTNSFWEGVDIVGDALSLLVITRLPFSVPSDPVFAARSDMFDNPFHEYAVPQAILRFKQGFGRLIRSTSDRGVCVVLDRRVVSRNYGHAFIDSLPECHYEVGPTSHVAESITGWFQQQ